MISTSQDFGNAIRQRRLALDLTQESLALSVNVGRRFIIHLEDGKETCQLGKALEVARAVGLRLVDQAEGPCQNADVGYQDLPDLENTR